MTKEPDEKRRWTEALDAEGVAAVRRALERSRAEPPGLIRIGQTSVAQGFAKAWLDWHDAHMPIGQNGGVVLAPVVVIVGFVGWLLGWR